MPSHLGLYAQMACIWEVNARKPGNVHRGRDFPDLTFLNFLTSAAAIGPVFDRAADQCVGQTVIDAVRATREVVATNTNLGIILLLAPLAAVSKEQLAPTGIASLLDGLDVQDARLVYEAIRLANPGGMGRVCEQDIREQPTEALRQIMIRAAGRDRVAAQYANGFQDVFAIGLPGLDEGLKKRSGLEQAVIYCHLHLMAHLPDTLIARKLGLAEAQHAAALAKAVLKHHWPAHQAGQRALEELDDWLCREGHARNPGTTADLVTACLFVALRQEVLRLPLDCAW